MELSYKAIFVATLLEFIFGAAYYGPVFGKIWGRMHGFDKLSKEVQEKMMKGMAPYYAIQLFVTIVTTTVLALFLKALPAGWNPYGMAGFFWLGFVVPTQVSAVIFGGTEPKWMLGKIMISAVGSLGCLMIATAILQVM